MLPNHLLVCAEPSTAEHIADLVRTRGYTAETANAAERALELVDRSDPGIVLLWSDLPGPGVAELTRRVRATSPVRVAAVLRPGDAGQASALLEAGADALLVDEHDLDFLVWALGQVVEGGLVLAPSLARALVTGGVKASVEPDGATPEEAPPAEAPPVPEALRWYEPGVDFTECDVAALVQEGAAQAALGCPNVLVQVNTPPRLPAIAERHALSAVVRILVEMACAESEPGSDVAVKAQRGDAGITVLFTDRGAGFDRKQVAAALGGNESEGDDITKRLNLARALVSVHGGILWAEPLPAGGNRVSFTIPEQPPVLSGVELKGALHALDLLERFERPPAPEPEPALESAAEVPVDDGGGSREEDLDLAAAVADATAPAQEPAPEPVEPELVEAEPAASLAELFELDPIAAGLDEVTSVPEPEVEEDELLAFLEPEPKPEPEPEAEEEELVAFLEPEPEPEPEAEEEVAPAAEAELETEEVVVSTEPDLEPEEDILVAALAEPEPEPVPEPATQPELPQVEPVALPEVEPVLEPPAADVPEEEAPEIAPVPVPEPVPAASAASAGREWTEQAPDMPRKPFVPDPLHPATLILRGLAEDYDDKQDGKPGF
jgi:DNA-binding NarL/FixJ family response regulator